MRCHGDERRVGWHCKRSDSWVFFQHYFNLRNIDRTNWPRMDPYANPLPPWLCISGGVYVSGAGSGKGSGSSGSSWHDKTEFYGLVSQVQQQSNEKERENHFPPTWERPHVPEECRVGHPLRPPAHMNWHVKVQVLFKLHSPRTHANHSPRTGSGSLEDGLSPSFITSCSSSPFSPSSVWIVHRFDLERVLLSLGFG